VRAFRGASVPDWLAWGSISIYLRRKKGREVDTIDYFLFFWLISSN
jgi:hypothetical protein